jgi:hypothetical protein
LDADAQQDNSVAKRQKVGEEERDSETTATWKTSNIN